VGSSVSSSPNQLAFQASSAYEKRNSGAMYWTAPLRKAPGRLVFPSLTAKLPAFKKARPRSTRTFLSSGSQSFARRAEEMEATTNQG
jgi:hypothetical protein